MTRSQALIITVDADGAVYLNDHLVGFSGQYIKPWQATEQVVNGLALMLGERLGWPREDPRE